MSRHGLDLSDLLPDIASFVAHAVAWSTIRRLVYALPGGWLWVVLGLALVVMALSARRRRRGRRSA